MSNQRWLWSLIVTAKSQKVPYSYPNFARCHNNDVIMSAMASQIISLTIVYSSVYSGTDKKTSERRIIGLCEGNSPVTGMITSKNYLVFMFNCDKQLYRRHCYSVWQGIPAIFISFHRNIPSLNMQCHNDNLWLFWVVRLCYYGKKHNVNILMVPELFRNLDRQKRHNRLLCVLLVQTLLVREWLNNAC